MPAGAGWEVEAGSRRVCWNERHRARLAFLRAGDGAHRASGESLEDGAEREGGRHRERSMHASLDQAKYFFSGRVEPWVEFKGIQFLIRDIQTQVYTRCCCGQK